mmetsp:Transcript_47316/g.122374  ORF Transcript_47316/g.122374 Transcript_47316/m.122374 type:complete len:1601 (-) Transcript_47316:361-5163(-)
MPAEYKMGYTDAVLSSPLSSPSFPSPSPTSSSLSLAHTLSRRAEYSSEEKGGMKAVYSVQRRGEAARFRSDLTPISTLYHGTSLPALYSILTSGLQLPKLLSRMGVERRHEGRLGYGIYLSPSFSTAASYSPTLRLPSPHTGGEGVRLVLACTVGVGKTYHTKAEMVGATSPPVGYDSITSLPKHKDLSSAFDDEEVVVFDVDQVVVTHVYVVEEGGQVRGRWEVGSGGASIGENGGSQNGGGERESIYSNVYKIMAGQNAKHADLDRVNLQSVLTDDIERMLSGVSKPDMERNVMRVHDNDQNWIKMKRRKARDVRWDWRTQVERDVREEARRTQAEQGRRNALINTVSKLEVDMIAAHATIAIVDTAAEVNVLQTFVNSSSSPIECKYVFPTPEGAAVTGMRAYIEDKEVIAVVKEKSQARLEYKQAVARGDGAYLAEQNEDESSLSLSVGNLPPYCTCTIRIVYVCELSAVRYRDRTVLSFTLPSSLTSSLAKHDLTQNWTKTVTHTQSLLFHSSAFFSVEGRVQSRKRMVRVWSPSHPDEVEVEIGMKDAYVKLKPQSEGRKGLKKDFRIEVEVEASEERSTTVWVEQPIQRRMGQKDGGRGRATNEQAVMLVLDIPPTSIPSLYEKRVSLPLSLPSSSPLPSPPSSSFALPTQVEVDPSPLLYLCLDCSSSMYDGMERAKARCMHMLATLTSAVSVDEAGMEEVCKRRTDRVEDSGEVDSRPPHLHLLSELLTSFGVEWTDTDTYGKKMDIKSSISLFRAYLSRVKVNIIMYGDGCASVMPVEVQLSDVDIEKVEKEVQDVIANMGCTSFSTVLDTVWKREGMRREENIEKVKNKGSKLGQPSAHIVAPHHISLLFLSDFDFSPADASRWSHLRAQYEEDSAAYSAHFATAMPIPLSLPPFIPFFVRFKSDIALPALRDAAMAFDAVLPEVGITEGEMDRQAMTQLARAVTGPVKLTSVTFSDGMREVVGGVDDSLHHTSIALSSLREYNYLFPRQLHTVYALTERGCSSIEVEVEEVGRRGGSGGDDSQIGGTAGYRQQRAGMSAGMSSSRGSSVKEREVVFFDERTRVYGNLLHSLSARSIIAKAGAGGFALLSPVHEGGGEREGGVTFIRREQGEMKRRRRMDMSEIEASKRAATPAIIDISCSYQLLSSFTSFVGVEERDDDRKAEMEKKKEKWSHLGLSTSPRLQVEALDTLADILDAIPIGVNGGVMMTTSTTADTILRVLSALPSALQRDKEEEEEKKRREEEQKRIEEMKSSLAMCGLADGYGGEWRKNSDSMALNSAPARKKKASASKGWNRASKSMKGKKMDTSSVKWGVERSALSGAREEWEEVEDSLPLEAASYNSDIDGDDDESEDGEVERVEVEELKLEKPKPKSMRRKPMMRTAEKRAPPPPAPAPALAAPAALRDVRLKWGDTAATMFGGGEEACNGRGGGASRSSNVISDISTISNTISSSLCSAAAASGGHRYRAFEEYDPTIEDCAYTGSMMAECSLSLQPQSASLSFDRSAKRGRRYQKGGGGARRLCCCICILVIVLVVITAIILGITLGLSNSNSNQTEPDNNTLSALSSSLSSRPPLLRTPLPPHVLDDNRQ